GDNRIRARTNRQPTDSFDAFDEPRVECIEFFAQRRTAHRLAAVQADHLRVDAVQVDDVVAAGLGVQQVNVLGDDAGYHTLALQRGQRPVPRVGQSFIHVPPANVITRP